MKTKFYFHKREFSVLFIMIFWLLCLSSTRSQTWIPLVKWDTTKSIIIQYDFGSIHLLGIGSAFQGSHPQAPGAIFHILEPISATPLFQLDATQTGSSLGSIKHWFLYNGSKYAFYESSQTGQTVYNYFQDPLSIGNLQLVGNGNNEILFNLGLNLNGDAKFVVAPTDPNTTTPLTIYSNGIKVNGFQLTQNPGLGYVLLSDANGNGSWVDPGNFNDKKWSINKDSDLYANPARKHVGIGFQNSSERIYQMLSILNGNILLSRTTSPIKDLKDKNGNIVEAPTSKNGSILFGDTVSSSNTLGEWGIEYESNYANYAMNGLNFWKPYSSGNGGGNKYLYLRNDGTIGIGTDSTFGFKLAVSGSILCTELKVRKRTDWPDYVLKNDYKLTPLGEVADYISKYQHLPDIPNAKDVSENGVNVGDMDVVLVKKVEELTKYLIEQQNKLNDQQNKLFEQQKQLIDQQKEIDELKHTIQNR
jgi:hypothetical protein